LQRGGDWAGTYNPSTQSYETINSDGILDSLKVVNAIIDRYASHPAVAGIEPSKFRERDKCCVAILSNRSDLKSINRLAAGTLDVRLICCTVPFTAPHSQRTLGQDPDARAEGILLAQLPARPD
jgi:hypothetical protein